MDIQEFYVFRAVRPLDEAAVHTGWRYLKFYIRSGYQDMSYTDKIDEASKFEAWNVEDIISSYHRAIREGSNHRGVEFIKVRITIESETVDLDKEEFLDEQRKRALGKLTVDEIKILGLESVATYEKLRTVKNNKDDIPF